MVVHARTFCFAWVTLFWLGMIACEDDTAAGLRGGGTPARDGSAPRSPRDGGSSGAPDGAEPEDANSSSSSSSSSGAPDAEAPDGDVQPGYCRVFDSFGVSLPLPGLSSVQDAVEFSITPDERILAWLDAGATLHIASRSSEASDFGAAELLAYTDPSFASASGLTLSADGLRLVLVNRDRDALGELTRASRDVPFGLELSRAPYAQIEPDAASEEGPLGFPVFGREDRMLAIARVRPAEPAYSVLISERAQAGDAWPLPSPRTESVLAVASAGSAQLKTVTGISVDGLTVFVRNESTAELFAVNRPNDGATFDSAYARALAPAHAAIPNAPCDRLYVLEEGALAVRRRLEE